MNGNEAAFPTVNGQVEHGISKRELMALMVLQGVLASGHYNPLQDKKLPYIVTCTVDLTDAMIAELAKPKEAV